MEVPSGRQVVSLGNLEVYNLKDFRLELQEELKSLETGQAADSDWDLVHLSYMTGGL